MKGRALVALPFFILLKRMNKKNNKRQRCFMLQEKDEGFPGVCPCRREKVESWNVIAPHAEAWIETTDQDRR
jgi:hypothetical protein